MFRPQPMHPAWAVALALVLAASALAAAGPAQAATSIRWETFSAGFACPKYTVTDAGAVLISAYVSDAETQLELRYWRPGTDPIEDPATYASTEATLAFDRETMQLTGSAMLIASKSKGAIGEAELALNFVATGAADSYRFRSGSGNHKVHGLAQWWSMDVSGQVILPGDVMVPLADCQGSVESTSLSANAPTSWVERYRQSGMFCAWPTTDGTALLELRRWEHGSWSGTLEVQTASGVYWSYFDELPGRGTMFRGDVVLGEGLGAEGVLVGALRGSVAFAATGQRVSESWRDGRWLGRWTTTILRPRGSFALSGELEATFVVNRESCTAHRDVYSLIGRS